MNGVKNSTYIHVYTVGFNKFFTVYVNLRCKECRSDSVTPGLCVCVRKTTPHLPPNFTSVTQKVQGN